MFELTPFFRTVSPNRRAATVYDPFRELEAMERAFFAEGSQCRHPRTFSTDIVDNGTSYTVQTDLPGFKKEDINIEITEDCMTVSAVRHSDYEDKDKKGNYVRMERSYGSYSRSYDLTGIDADKISANYSDGVLSIDLPKAEEKKPDSRKIEIK